MRYIRKLKTTTSLGPTEERNPGLWVGYDIEGVDADLEEHGLIRVDDWSEEELAARGVTTFRRVDPESLGLEKKR
jgi:hypothetical protein